MSNPIIICCLCGRGLSNDPDAPNAAAWTPDKREPYCADDCIHTVQAAVSREALR